MSELSPRPFWRRASTYLAAGAIASGAVIADCQTEPSPTPSGTSCAEAVRGNTVDTLKDAKIKIKPGEVSVSHCVGQGESAAVSLFKPEWNKNCPLDLAATYDHYTLKVDVMEANGFPIHDPRHVKFSEPDVASMQSEIRAAEDGLNLTDEGRHRLAPCLAKVR